MPRRLQIVVYEGRRLVETAEFDGTVELGRQKDLHEQLYARKRDGELWRWVIAGREETNVGRNQMQLTPLPNDMLRITNGSDRMPVRLADNSTLPLLPPGQMCDLPLPVTIVVGSNRTIRVRKATSLNSLPGRTLPPSRGPSKVSRLPALVGTGDQVRREDVLAWLNQVGELVNLPAGTPEYYQYAVRIAVDTVEMDAARLLLWSDGEWQQHALQTNERTDPSLVNRPSTQILERVLLEKKTFWEEPGNEMNTSESLSGVDTVVASPILDRDGEVIGALYGERQRNIRTGLTSVGRLEAQLLELVARIVAGGLARVEDERKTAEAESTVESFFGRDLARHLLADPELLKARDREVSVLFCDIRGFSRLSEKLGAALTFGWCGDVLQRMTQCVLAEGGVIVDYVGDALMAMWGAPSDQPDHAQRACRTALAMVRQLASINQEWQNVLGEPTALSLGINTGVAMVGNVGSKEKMKYGALGNTVNLASRVQGAAKYFKCDILITGDTFAKLPEDACITRRLGQVRVVNIEAPVTLYQLMEPDWDPAPRAKQEYEYALDRFEKRDFTLAARVLGNWRSACPGDDPPLVLLYRAVRAMVEGVAPGHPVWEFKDK